MPDGQTGNAGWVNSLNSIISTVGTVFTGVWSATHGPQGTGSNQQAALPVPQERKTDYTQWLLIGALVAIGAAGFFLIKKRG